MAKKKKRTAKGSGKILKLAALAIGIYLLTRKDEVNTSLPPIKQPIPGTSTGQSSNVSGRNRVKFTPIV